jgi:outer membrane protein
MMVVIDKYANDNGFALILDVSNPQTPVLYASNTIDITSEIVGLYDKGAALPQPKPPSSTNAAPGVVPGSSAAPAPAAPKPVVPAPKK